MGFWKSVWCHRTKILGAIGLAAGCFENYLSVNHIALLPDQYRGYLLSIFAALVFWVGLYNTLREGWEQS